MRELGFHFEEGEAAMLRYARYVVNQVAAGSRPALTELYRAFNNTNYHSLLQRFISLYWAWEDFDLGDAFSCYWPSATPETIEQVVKQAARQWLAVSPPPGSTG